MAKIVTFYSYKGGVGRTMALVNVAHVMAHRGYRVLLVDLDLEAPGMTHFFAEYVQARSTRQLDSIDFLIEAKRTLDDPTFKSRTATVSLADYVTRIDLPTDWNSAIPIAYRRGRIDLMPAWLDNRTSSVEERDYLERLDDLDLPGIFAAGGPAHQFGAHLKQYFLRSRFETAGDEFFALRRSVTATYDFVLLDSRTGLSEIAGLCVGPVTDLTVVCTGLNRQNVAGTIYFMRKVGLLGSAPSKPHIVVAGPVPPWHSSQSSEQLRSLGVQLGARDLLEVPYHPLAAISEPIFVSTEPNDPIALAYDDIATAIIDEVQAQYERDDSYRRAASALSTIAQGSRDEVIASTPISLSALRVTDDADFGEELLQFPTGITLSALIETDSDVHSPTINRLPFAAAAAALAKKDLSCFDRARQLTTGFDDDDLRKRVHIRLTFLKLRAADYLGLDATLIGADNPVDIRILKNAVVETSNRDSLANDSRRVREERFATGVDAFLTMLALDGHGISSGQAGQRVSVSIQEELRSWTRVLWGPRLMNSPVFAAIDTVAPLIMKSQFTPDERQQVRDLIASQREVLRPTELGSSRGRLLPRMSFLQERREAYPVGLWPESVMISLLAIGFGTDAMEEIAPLWQAARQRYGYAWRVIVDWRHLKPLATAQRLSRIIREDDRRAIQIEDAIDAGLVLL